MRNVIGIASIALLTFCLTPAVHGETLAGLLAAHKIPADILPLSDTQRSVASYAVSANNTPFLLAYYDDNGSGMLPQVLHLIRYDAQTGQLSRADLRGAQQAKPFHGLDSVMTRVSDICLGSSLNISETNGFITIDTHINPSAGCVLILKSNLEFSGGLFGWVMAK